RRACSPRRCSRRCPRSRRCLRCRRCRHFHHLRPCRNRRPQETTGGGIFPTMTPALAQRPRTDRAFERLYRRHVHDVYCYALVVLESPEDAEDVTQTTFRNAYRAFTQGERPRSAQNWLIALAHQICRQRFRGLDDHADEAVPDEELPTADDLRRALGHLPFNVPAALVMG